MGSFLSVPSDKEEDDELASKLAGEREIASKAAETARAHLRAAAGATPPGAAATRFAAPLAPFARRPRLLRAHAEAHESRILSAASAVAMLLQAGL